MFEATFIIALCQHLLKQGYRASDIVIISMYIQQVRLLKQVKLFPWWRWSENFQDINFLSGLLHFQLQSKEKELSSLAITSVDNFQGQESPIVLLSLVRNNKGTIGFLRTSNRTCVALSRARNGKSPLSMQAALITIFHDGINKQTFLTPPGLYIFGNIELLASQSPVWEKLKDVLNKQGAVGPGLPVVCSNHLTSNVADLRRAGNPTPCQSCL